MELKRSDKVQFNGQDVYRIYLNGQLVYERSNVDSIGVVLPVSNNFSYDDLSTQILPQWYRGFWDYGFAEKILKEANMPSYEIIVGFYDYYSDAREKTAPETLEELLFHSFGTMWDYLNDKGVLIAPLENGYTIDPVQIDGTNKDLSLVVDNITRYREGSCNYGVMELRNKLLLVSKEFLSTDDDWQNNNGLPDLSYADDLDLAICEVRYKIDIKFRDLLLDLYNKTYNEGTPYQRLVVICTEDEESQFNVLAEELTEEGYALKDKYSNIQIVHVNYKDILTDNSMKAKLEEIIDNEGGGSVNQDGFVSRNSYTVVSTDHERTLYVCLSDSSKIQSLFRVNMDRICNERGGGSGVYISFVKSGDLEETGVTELLGDLEGTFATAIDEYSNPEYDKQYGYIISELVRLYNKASADGQGLDVLKSVLLILTSEQHTEIENILNSLDTYMTLEWFSYWEVSESDIYTDWWELERGVNESYMWNFVSDAIRNSRLGDFIPGYSYIYTLADGMYTPISILTNDETFKSLFQFEYAGDITHHIAGILNFDVCKGIIKVAENFTRQSKITALPMEESEPTIVKYPGET